MAGENDVFRPDLEESSRLRRARTIFRVAERELARGPASAAETRRWLRAVSVSFGFDHSTAENLVVVGSELLANAVLHANGPFSVSVEVERALVRIGVRDRSASVPVMKAFDELAVTGRGLRIVAAAAEAWGVERHADGKTVWADLPLPGTTSDDTQLQSGDWARRGELVARYRPQPAPWASRTSSNQAPEQRAVERRTAARTGGEGEAALSLEAAAMPVLYRRVPIDQFVELRVRIEAMLRESTLIVLGGPRDDVPVELLELAGRATTQFAPVARAISAATAEPLAVHGESGLGDFAVGYQPAAASQFRSFAAHIVRLNEWCESNHLLVDPLPEKMMTLYRWSVEEAVRQIHAGAEPAAFAEVD